MGWDDFHHRTQERAYFKYLNRIHNNIPGNSFQDWEEAEREQCIEERIREEAFLHSRNNGYDPLTNWVTAQNEIMQRLNFLAYYLHEANMHRTPQENWIEAQKLYISQF